MRLPRGLRRRRRQLLELLSWLGERGYSVARENSNHYKLRDPEGRAVVSFPVTPSDGRSDLNTTARIKARIREMEA